VSVLLSYAHTIRASADYDGMCRAQARPWPTTDHLDHPERSKKLVCGPRSASEPLCIECIGWPQYLLVSRKRAAIGFRPLFRCEVRVWCSGVTKAALRATQDVPFRVDQVLRSHNPESGP
jgi:hypothetical protein